MSVYYDLYQNPPSTNRKESPLHARIVPKGIINTEKFIELVSKANGFCPAILKGTLQAITDELHDWLEEGWIVEVGELGHFSLSLKSDHPVMKRNTLAVHTTTKCKPTDRQ